MYHKLVRDKIPNIIEVNGENPIVEILDDDRYKEELEKKLIEECQEVLAAEGKDRIMELADLLEVMTSLAELENKTLDDINFVRKQKKNERGGFSKKLFLKDVK